ncbi:MAG: polymer-forming cytoskeletal protein [Betaproteobacteria bacterium]|jgi:cytoskeletal protein CcmA (bactofilin family)|nr:polymer-forming cytoskeletal protein [Rhodocyclaceae bacterium]MCE2722056.1 polymer-forming cytoskeletal protein [Betaproteobacteria bacterium]
MFNLFKRRPAKQAPAVDPAITQERDLLEIDAEEHGIFTQLAPGTVFAGDIEAQEGMHLQGQILGNVSFGQSGRGAVVLVENASIEGNVDGPLIHVFGTIRGDIKAQEIFLHSSAIVEGQITYRKLKMSELATVNGALRKMPDSTVAQFASPLQPQYAELGAR